MKKLIAFIIIVILIFIIYIFNCDKKIYYVNISNSGKYYSDVLKNIDSKLEKTVNLNNKDLRITDIYNNILNNKKINKNQTYQNLLIKADILTIELGQSELNYKKDIEDIYDYIDELVIDIDKLLKIIRTYDKEKIYFVKYKVKNNKYKEIYDYLNIKVEDLCNKYSVNLIEENALKNLQYK